MLLKADRIEAITESIGRSRILIMGDIMLDEYWFGSVDRISPEAPVPVVRVDKKSVRVGGAANVALNLVALGAEVVVAGWVGDDAGADELTGLLEREGVDCSGICHRHGVCQ